MPDCVDFGIIPNIEYNKNYADYGREPYKTVYAKYNCISVPDDFVNDWISLTYNIPTYVCSLDRKYMGIDHWGITIIPPESVKLLLDIVHSYMEKNPDESIKKLAELLNTAIDNGKYVICNGL